MSRRVGLAAVAAMACAPLTLLAISPSLLRGNGVEEQRSVRDVFLPTALGVFGGAVPYRDFPLEYPLLSVPVMVLPAFVGTSERVYAVAFGVEMLLINAVLLQVVAADVERTSGKGSIAARLAWYCVFFALLSRMIVSRIDLAPTLLAFWSAVLWSRGKSASAGALAAFGALSKIFPGFVAVAGGLRDLSGSGGRRYRGVATFAVVSAAGMALWWAIGGDGAFRSLAYHGERGIEIGSLYAGALLAVGRLTGWTYAAPFDHGSFNVTGPGADALSTLSGFVQLALIVTTLVRFAGAGFPVGTRYAGALILATVATAKVLSPQYFIWLLPFVVALDEPVGGKARALFLVVCLLSVLIYPVLFHRAVTNLSAAGILVLNLRNVATLALWWLLTFGGEPVYPPASRAEPAP